MNKTIIKTKTNIGMVGLALLAASFISIPLGSIALAKFYRHKKSTIFILYSAIILSASIFTGNFNLTQAEVDNFITEKGYKSEIIKEELIEIRDGFNTPRMTQIEALSVDMTIEDLITSEEMVVTLSQNGYAKSQPLTSYQAQRRGGKGKSATAVKDEDFITKLLIANTHDTLLCFSSIGKVYWLKVHKLPVGSRISKGKPIVNLLPLSEEEKITTILPIRQFEEDKCVFMATDNGTVKRVALSDFSRPRTSGIIAIELVPGDSLIGAEITNSENEEVIISTNTGKSIRFKCSDVRCMGRGAKGVRGIKLKSGQKVISLIVLEEDGAILTATTNGYGKRTPDLEFSTIGRGGQGVIAIQTEGRNGEVIGALQVFPQDELMLISDQGTLVRIRVEEISVVGRNTKGVRLINLAENEHLVGIQKIQDIKIEDEYLADESSVDDNTATDTENNKV